MRRIALLLALAGCATPALAPAPEPEPGNDPPRGPLHIVSLGDSLASGEGNPDVPGLQPQWLDATCHRATAAGPRQAADALAREGVAVEFVSFACSGAKVPDVIERQLPEALERFPPDQRIDALLLSIGGNDVGFAEAVAMCMVNNDLRGPCQDLDFFQGDGSVAARAALLRERYRLLRDAIQARLPHAAAIYVTEYPAPTTDAAGAWCDRAPLGDPLMGIERQEAQWASETAIATLNQTIRDEVTSPEYARLGWRWVGGIADKFRGHGYCAGDERWLNTVTDSLLREGSVQGAVHPNERGQAVIRDALLPELEALAR